jgi:hypothetical protein
MFGPAGNIDRMIGTMSVPELVQLARNPSGGDPNIQYAAISEIEKRNRAKPAPQGQVNQPTVIENMALQAMTPSPQTPAPGDPISSGVAALMAQRGQGGPPKRMNRGGAIATDMTGIIEQLRPLYGDQVDAMTPEEARELVGQFYGDNSYYDELIPGIKEDEAEATTSRNRDLWLALAQAGFGMASTGNIGQGALMGLEQARGAFDNYREGRRDARGRRDRLTIARGQRADQQAGMGLEALLGSQRDASAAERDLIGTSAGIAEAGAQIEAQRSSGGSQLERIADMLLQENADEVVEEQYTFNSNNGPQVGMRRRPYNRNDAMRDALMMVGGSGSGRGADDLNERTRAALAIADQFSGASDEQREAANQFLQGVMSGEIGNVNTTTRGGRGGDTATGASAPSESSYIPQGQEEYRAQRLRERGLGVVGQRDGRDIYDPYAGAE